MDEKGLKVVDVYEKRKRDEKGGEECGCEDVMVNYTSGKSSSISHSNSKRQINLEGDIEQTTGKKSAVQVKQRRRRLNFGIYRTKIVV